MEIDDHKLRQDILAIQAKIEKKLGGFAKGPAARALFSVGEVYMTEAKKRVPVKYGTLRSSGHVKRPEQVADSWQVRLVFGGPSAPYAAFVHENLRAYHRVGQAKYLESVVLERRTTFARDVAAMMIGGARGFGAVQG